MNDAELERLGRIMAGVLRHFPERFGLTMDGRGWVDIAEMVTAVRDGKPRYHWLRPHHIVAVAETDPKGRYQIDGGQVRATYAHSVNVTLDDLPEAATEELYYPCSEEEVDLILENGLKPQDRTKLHLSGTYEKAVEAGRIRMEDPVILAVDVEKAKSQGVEIFRAAKTVYICDGVPADALRRMEEPPATESTGE
jgi:putative RNA 2'-phosphotransferase